MSASHFGWIGLGLLITFCGCEMAVTQNAVDKTAPGENSETTPEGQANVVAANSADSDSPSVQEDPALEPTASPPEVVQLFLESLRQGDNKRAVKLLTDMARYATAKENLAVQHPGSPTARYQVGQAEYVSGAQERAHVPSTWAEGDGSQPYDITWILNRQREGWRIKGMITPLSEQQPQVFLDFEDPASMMERLEQANSSVEDIGDASQPKATHAR